MIRPLPLLALLCLAACQQQPATDAPTVEPTAGPASTPAKDALMPGQWSLSSTPTKLSGGNTTPEMRRAVVAKTAAYDTCIPADEAALPDANFFAGGSTSECKYSNHDMKGGRLSATIVCNATPGTITMTMNGTYTANAIDADATMVTSGTPEGDVTQNTRLEARYLGECRAPQPDVQR